MNAIVKSIEAKCKQIIDKGDELLIDLQTFGWEDKRPTRVDAREEDTDIMLLQLASKRIIPAKTKIPQHFITAYHQWFSGCLAIVEANMPSRRVEILGFHEGRKNPRNSPTSMLSLLQSDEMTFDDQLRMTSNIIHIIAIVSSIPDYLESRLYNLELAVAQAYIGDQLIRYRTENMS